MEKGGITMNITAKSYNDSIPHEILFAKEKSVLVSLEKLST